MFKNKEIKNGVTSSIIASLLFLIILQPLLGLLWKLIVDISSKTYTGYIDNIYKNAALGQRNWIDVSLLQFLLGLIFIFIFSFLLKFKRILNRVHTDNEIEAISDKDKRDNFLKEKFDKSSKRIKTIIKHYKKIVISLYLYQIFIILFFSDTLIKAYADLQINTSFSQRITVLSPYLEVQKEKEIKAKWALMETRKDFEIINAELESIALQKKVKLPKLLLE